ncbi:DDE-type integrase/transposase/recombinase [Arthrospira platensis SPKY2]
MWMTDMMFGPTLRTGQGKTVQTRLFALLDDCSRVCVGARFFTGEGTDNLLQVLHEAVLRRGIPQRLYADNGKAFTSKHLNVVCANLNIRLLHARPYHSWSKGKVERFFLTVRTDFLQTLTFKPVASLEELNAALQTWLDQRYHRQIHSSLDGDNPAQRFMKRSVRLRTVQDAQHLQTLFLHKVTRRVRKDATVALEGRHWEVSTALRGLTVELRYDPVGFTRVDVYHEGRLHCQAQLLDKQSNARIHVPHPNHTQTHSVQPSTTR